MRIDTGSNSASHAHDFFRDSHGQKSTEEEQGTKFCETAGNRDVIKRYESAKRRWTEKCILIRQKQ